MSMAIITLEGEALSEEIRDEWIRNIFALQKSPAERTGGKINGIYCSPEEPGSSIKK
jgi:hypothetical protein